MENITIHEKITTEEDLLSLLPQMDFGDLDLNEIIVLRKLLKEYAKSLSQAQAIKIHLKIKELDDLIRPTEKFKLPLAEQYLKLIK